MLTEFTEKFMNEHKVTFIDMGHSAQYGLDLFLLFIYSWADLLIHVEASTVALKGPDIPNSCTVTGIKVIPVNFSDFVYLILSRLGDIISLH